MPLSQFKPENYSQLLQTKAERVAAIFSGLAMPAPEIHASAPSHYRMRAEFRLWHEGDDLFYAMFDPADPKTPIRIDNFPVASRAISDLMEPLRRALLDSPLLNRRLFQVEFLSTQTEEILVTLIYHKRLEEDWIQAAEELARHFNIQVIGRSRKQKCVIDRDFVTETLNIGDRALHYRQYEGGFTQPNAGINERMLSWARREAGECQGDLLELYCGNGNFTVALAEYFPKVLATEISKTSVRAARENFALNGVDNVEVIRMSAEEVSSALRGEREFRRLRDIDLGSYELGTVFVDPPRAGLDDFTRSMIADYRNILYISCNPETLYRDISQLHGHVVEKFALFDQFPYTEHMECGVLLKAKD